MIALSEFSASNLFYSWKIEYCRFIVCSKRPDKERKNGSVDDDDDDDDSQKSEGKNCSTLVLTSIISTIIALDGCSIDVRIRNSDVSTTFHIQS